MNIWRRADEAAAAEILGRELTAAEKARATAYLGILARWQAVHRMVGSVDPRWMLENLFIDSLLFLRVVPDWAGDVLDFGSGAGVPGIPLKIVRSELRITLLEAQRRRASFLRAVIRELGLEGAAVVHARGEEWIPAHRHAFDAVVLRCAGRGETMLRLGVQAVRAGGLAVMAGPPGDVDVTFGELVRVRGAREGTIRSFVISRPGVGGHGRGEEATPVGDENAAGGHCDGQELGSSGE